MSNDLELAPSEHGSSVALRAQEISQIEVDAIEYLYDVVRHINDCGQLDCTDPLVDLIEKFLSEPRGSGAAEKPGFEGVNNSNPSEKVPPNE